jgi:hypothetical protein
MKLRAFGLLFLARLRGWALVGWSLWLRWPLIPPGARSARR